MEVGLIGVTKSPMVGVIVIESPVSSNTGGWLIMWLYVDFRQYF